MIVTVGKFDALHRGHRSLVAEAARLGGSVGLLRFDGLAEALGWAARLPLVAEADRARILATWPAAPQDVSLPFAAVRDCDPEAFVALLQERLGARGLVLGEDFRGGRGRRSDATAFAAAARAAGLEAAVLPAVRDGGTPLSSTRIRRLIEDGAVDEAASGLGRWHRVVGTVDHGDGRGRSLGIPTANLARPGNLPPGTGVYAAWAHADGLGPGIPAVVNIGRLPTIGADRPLTIEAHLLDWQGDLYGRRLDLTFAARLRGEQRFPGLEALVAQIHADIAAARQRLAGLSERGTG